MTCWQKYSVGALKIESSIAVGIAAIALLPAIASAQVVSTEIMYDVPGADTGREWVEVYNAGANSVPLSSWRLLENGTKHKIVAASGVDSLAPQSYAVIAEDPAKFRTDWPQFSGTLFDSTFSLGNDSDTIELYDASSTQISSASYQSSSGAAGDGNSLNASPGGSGAFTPHTPSPGAPMSTAVIPPPPPKQVPVKLSTSRVSPKPVPTARKNAPSGNVPAPSRTIIGEAPAQEDLTLASTDASHGSQTATPLAGQAAPIAPRSWWWMGAGVLALLGGGAMFVSRSKAKDEWKIEESSG